MTQFNNIRPYSDHVIDPALKLLLDKLALDRPQWVLKAREKYYQWGFLTDHLPGVGIRYTRDVDVLENGELLGTVGIDNSQRSGSMANYVYYVEAWRINRVRGNRDVKRSVRLDVMAREAKKLLKPRNMAEIVDTARPLIAQGWVDTMRVLTSPVDTVRAVKSRSDLQLYAFCMANDKEVDAAKFATLLEQLRSPEFENIVANFELAMQMAAHTEKSLDVILNDGSFLVGRVDSGEAVSRMAFDDMPIPWQEHIAVLRLANDGELIRGVGYRLDANHFRIIE